MNPSVYGQEVTFTATVTASAPGSGTPTGQVMFYDGSTKIDTATLSNGSASYSTSALAVGRHSITVQYSGDTNLTGSTSATLTQVVKQDGSETVVTSSLNPSAYGQGVTFTATVTAAAPGSGTPTGQVTFYDGTAKIDTATLSNGTASYTTSAIAAGGNSITVQYQGDGNFTASTSAKLTQTVNQDGTTTVVSSSANPTVVGQSVTFTAAVSAAAPGSGTPTGQVMFYDGTTKIDTATLSSGSASYSTSALAVGRHSITVQYNGDTDFTTSTSATITQTVTQTALATLKGEVYNDISGDGTLQAGDPGLSGWTVRLLNSSNSVVTTVSTDSSGDYLFTGVVSGSYTVAVVATAGYIPTGPTSGTLPVTATAGQTSNNLNFGEFQTVTVSGEVFDD